MNPNPIATALARLQRAHLDAVESAGHPSSKPHREAIRSFQRHVADMASIARKLQQECEKAWTAVTEGLPDDELLVLIAVNDDDVWTGYRLADTWRYVDARPIENERVTHWMSMPTPPTRTAE
jgi:hypothetical protein